MLFKNKKKEDNKGTTLPRPQEVKNVETKPNNVVLKENSENGLNIQKQVLSEKYRNIDFSKFSKEKMFSIISELLIENNKLNQEIKKLNSESLESAETISSSRKKEKDIEDKILYIAQRIAPELVIKLNKGEQLSLNGKCNIIIESVLNDKAQRLTEIKQLKETLQANKILLNELKNQLSERIEVSNNQEVLKEFTEKDLETFAGTKTAKDLDGKNDETFSQSLVIKAVDLEKVKASIGDIEMKILEAIGKHGISSYVDLYDKIVGNGTDVTTSKLGTALDNLKLNSVIDMDIVISFANARGVRMYNLSNEIGKNLYRELFKEKPVLSEKERIRRENDNLEHGYSIKDCVNCLEEFGYKEISMDRKTNMIPISGANSWIPDIIATNPISGRKEYFEIEMGTHNEENFNNKMDKANLKASVLKIVCPNKQVKQKIINKVENWRALNLKKASSMAVFIQTFADFKAKEDGYVFDTTRATIEEMKNNAKNKQNVQKEQNGPKIIKKE